MNGKKKGWLLGHSPAGILVLKNRTPIFINLDNVLTVERQDGLTTVVMMGGEKVYLDTMPETLFGAVAPAGPV